MKVTKITKTWGSKGMGASTSVWMPAQTFGTLEVMAGGRAIDEIHASLEAGLRDIVREAWPANKKLAVGTIDTVVETYDDQTGERFE